MRLHSAAELVLQLMYSATGGARKTGAHISADKARLDFSFAVSVAPLLPAIAALVNEAVAADLSIECGYWGESSERRSWRVNGFEPVPCCGTHPLRTGEIGAVRLKRENPGKGVERVEIRLRP
jgi:Ser-tRNA(Ala) deacylase AlaX